MEENTQEAQATPTTETSKALGSEITLTQERLDGIIKERLQRDRKATQAEILSKLGFDTSNIDEAVKTIETTRQQAKSAQDQTTPLTNKIAELEAERDKYITERDQAIKSFKDYQIKEAVRAKAHAVKANNPDDLLAFLDQSTFVVDDKVVEDKLSEAVDKLKEAKPYLFTNDYKGIPSVADKGAVDNKKAREDGVEAMRKALKI